MTPLRLLLSFLTVTCAIANPAMPTAMNLIANVVGVISGFLFVEMSDNPLKIVREINGEAENKLLLVEQEIEVKRGELERIAQQQMAEVQVRIETANAELEQDKQDFLAAHEEMIEEFREHIARLESRIEFLESELAAAENAIASYEAPRLPESATHQDIVARRVIEILLKKKIVADFKGAWIEDGFILVRIRPRDCGEREIKRHLNQIQIELDLAEPVRTSTKHGSVQLWLKPQELLSHSLDAEPIRATMNHLEPENEPSGTDWNLEEPDDKRLKNFSEPQRTLDPYGSIKQLERDWILWLWYYHQPKPVRNQKRIIRKIWGASAGSGNRYVLARDRLKQILADAGISL